MSARWNGLWRKGAGTEDDPNNGRLINRLLGFDAWLYCRYFDTRMATLRGLYWWLVRRYEIELCQHCGRPVRIVFHVPDVVWTAAIGCERFPDGEAAPGVLCPACVDELAEPNLGGYLSWTCEVSR